MGWKTRSARWLIGALLAAGMSVGLIGWQMHDGVGLGNGPAPYHLSGSGLPPPPPSISVSVQG